VLPDIELVHQLSGRAERDPPVELILVGPVTALDLAVGFPGAWRAGAARPR